MKLSLNKAKTRPFPSNGRKRVFDTLKPGGEGLEAFGYGRTRRIRRMPSAPSRPEVSAFQSYCGMFPCFFGGRA